MVCPLFIAGGVKDGFIETGSAIGEGAAVALDPELTAKLVDIYGTDVASLQKAALAIRVLASVTGAAAVGKAGSKVAEATTKAVVKKLDEVAVQKAEAKILADRMKEVAFHKDDNLFQDVAEKMIVAERSGWKDESGKTLWPPENEIIGDR